LIVSIIGAVARHYNFNRWDSVNI